MLRVVSLAIVILVAAVDASQQYYYTRPGVYTPLGPWGLEGAITDAEVMPRRAGNDPKEITHTSRKRGKDAHQVAEAKSTHRFSRAVETVEDAVAHAIDDEVETLFPHH